MWDWCQGVSMIFISLRSNPITPCNPPETVQVLSGKFKPNDYRFCDKQNWNPVGIGARTSL